MLVDKTIYVYVCICICSYIYVYVLICVESFKIVIFVTIMRH